MRHEPFFDSEPQEHSEIIPEDNIEQLEHRKAIKKLLEKRLERKRLREEFDELDGEFDWDEFDK